MTMRPLERYFGIAIALYGAILSFVWLYDGLFDGAEASFGHASVELGHCPSPYFMEGRSCLVNLVTTRDTLIEHATIILVASLCLTYFAFKRLATGALLVAAVGAWITGAFWDGIPFLGFVVLGVVLALQRINRQMPDVD
jgi:hypothetical protein